LTLDRYADLVLAQTFRAPLSVEERDRLEAWARAQLGFARRFVYNHRGKKPHETFDRWHAPDAEALGEVVARELGVRFAIRARHRGLDPWLFLDLRAARRILRELSPGRSVLNLFAYTASAGITAAQAGASEVWNVDFSRTNLDVGRRHAELNDLSGRGIQGRAVAGDGDQLVWIVEDVFPVLWQLAGAPVKGRGAEREYQRFDARTFDLIFLDPPAWSKGPFGAVDIEHDYPSLFKPCVRIVGDGGRVIATNHAAAVSVEAWSLVLARTAEKAGRPVRGIEIVPPDKDFPSFDGRPPLKIAVVSF
jgi:23S rRNA (cytosine1962-C5)-methyltransferase